MKSKENSDLKLNFLHYFHSTHFLHYLFETRNTKIQDEWYFLLGSFALRDSDKAPSCNGN